LQRLRDHRVAELSACKHLPIPVTFNPGYDYEILACTAELGGGWQLRFLQDGKDVGEHIFSTAQADVGLMDWWTALSEKERVLRLQRTVNHLPADAYRLDPA
jgi:hypothetical protein